MASNLQRLISEGLLPIGSQLFHAGRNGQEVTAGVVAGGLEVNGTTYPSPSTAAGAVAGHATNGWTYWRVRSSGGTLADLRRTS